MVIGREQLLRIQSTYPGPISAAAWQVVAHAGEVEPLSSPRRLVDLFEVTLKYVCALLLGHYRRRANRIVEIEKQLGGLRRPLLGHWRELQRSLIETLRPADDDPLISEVCRVFTGGRKGRHLLTAYGELGGITGDAQKRMAVSHGDIADQVVSYSRWLNETGRHVDPPRLEAEMASLRTLVIGVLLDLQCLAHYPLGYAKEIWRDRQQPDHVRMVRCMGTSQHWRVQDTAASREVVPGHCYVCSDEEGSLVPIVDLHPCILYMTCTQGPRREDQTFVLVQTGAEAQPAATYFSYECGHAFSPQEPGGQDLLTDVRDVVDYDRWEDRLVAEVTLRYGRYLEPYLDNLRQERGRPGYAVEYQRISRLLREPEVFGLPASLAERILRERGIEAPAPEALDAVPPPPCPVIGEFVLTPATIHKGESALLRWQTEGADKVAITPLVGEVESAGQREVLPTESTTFVLQAANADGVSESRTATVELLETLPPPTIAWFTAMPERVAPGEAATLEWQTQGAEQVTIEPLLGEVDTAGQREVTPSASTTYTLRATNSIGERCHHRVRVDVESPKPVPQPGSLAERWRHELPEPIRQVLGAPSAALTLAVGATGQLFLLDGEGGESWACRAEAPIRAATWGPDGRSVFVADWNGLVRCYDAQSATPLWEAQVLGVVSALETGTWDGHSGAFVGTWRRGLFFCNAKGETQLLAESQATISRIQAWPEGAGCAVGEWEGGVTIYRDPAQPPAYATVHQPVQGLSCLRPGSGVLVATRHGSFYGLSAAGEVFGLHESSQTISSWALAATGGRCYYCTETGQHHEVRITDDGGRCYLEARLVRDAGEEKQELLATDTDGSYLVAQGGEQALMLYVGDALCERIALPSPLSASHLDPYGAVLSVATGRLLRSLLNQHKLNHSRPAKLNLTVTAPPGSTSDSPAPVTLLLANLGERPAFRIQGTVKGRRASRPLFEVAQVPPGATVQVPGEGLPGLPDLTTATVELRYADAGESRVEIAGGLVAQ